MRRTTSSSSFAQEPGVLPGKLQKEGVDADQVLRVTGRVVIVGKDRTDTAAILPEDGLIARFDGEPAISAAEASILDQ
jgi:hypothetical protein